MSWDYTEEEFLQELHERREVDETNDMIDKWIWHVIEHAYRERDETRLEIERLNKIMPPVARGQGVVGEGSWATFAEGVVKERDALAAKLEQLQKHETG